MNKPLMYSGIGLLGLQVIGLGLFLLFSYLASLPSISSQTANLIYLVIFNVLVGVIAIGFIIAGSSPKE